MMQLQGIGIISLLIVAIASFIGHLTSAADLDEGNMLIMEFSGLSPAEIPTEYGDENLFASLIGASAVKRAASSSASGTMRNALIRFGPSPRSSATMRNALVRFGKRSAPANGANFDDLGSIKRNSAPEPFVRFGRSPHQRRSAAAVNDENSIKMPPGFAFAFL